jgi:Uma2 family endonuclease
MDPARKPATYADLAALPEGVRAEIIGGEIILHPSSLPEHGYIQGGLGRWVGGPYQYDGGRGGPGGWWIIPEIDVRISPDDTVRPDLSGWRRERLPSPWGKRPIDVVPDWICEILSPSNVRHDQVVKRSLYARQAVPYYWIVDPDARTLTALQLSDARWIEVGVWDETATVRIPPCDAIDLEVGRLFPPLPTEP